MPCGGLRGLILWRRCASYHWLRGRAGKLSKEGLATAADKHPWFVENRGQTGVAPISRQQIGERPVCPRIPPHLFFRVEKYSCSEMGHPA